MKQTDITKNLFSSLLCCLLLLSCISNAQSLLSGTVKDKKGIPIPYATVFLKDANEGSTTDTTGNFSIKTNLKGQQTLVVSFVGYEPLTYPLILEDKEYNLRFVLKEAYTSLDEVVISAGMIEARNDNVVTILKPLDIVTTAGGQGDIIGAIQTLPGVQRNGGDQTGLMVRGGDVSESIVIIDGTTAQNAFSSNIPGVSQRSRFGPFQFKGTSFSSGGYSVRYGQALSSVLELQTNDLPEESTLNLGMNFAGIALSGSKLIENNALEFSGSYMNLAPYYAIASTNVDFFDVPKGGSFSARWLSKVGNQGIFKMNFQQSFSKTGVTIADPELAGTTINYGLQNENTFFNTSYTHWLKDKLQLFTTVAFSNNTDHINLGTIPAYRNDSRLQGRAEIEYEINRKFNLLIGTDLQRISYRQQYDTLQGKFDETLLAGYLESEFKPKRWFGIKAGVRAEYSEIIQAGSVAPRLSMAAKTGSSSQFSMATGLFYQTAPACYLLQHYMPGFQQAIHYLLNYQWISNDRTFRVEAYYKDYKRLIREKEIAYNPNPYRFDFGVVDNSGSGYAKGIDVFWRDKKTIKNFDYWISYSLIDTKRLYQNYLSAVTPDYVSTHNLNLITKYFIESLQTNLSFSYNYASGRGYYNPNATEFLSDKAPDYHNLALGISYLTTVNNLFAVVYLSLDNITDQHNILGYRYSNNGQQRYPMLPPVYRSIFLGVKLSLSNFNKEEL